MSSQPQEHIFTKAQMRRFNELQQNVRRAQEEMQSFIDYLGEEHDLAQDKKWVIGTRGFVEASPEQAAQMAQLPPMPPVPTAIQNGHPTVEKATTLESEG